VTAWAQLLHFYQPPTQAHEIVQRIANESYRPLVKVLLAHPKARIAVNMNAVLTEMLVDHGIGDGWTLCGNWATAGRSSSWGVDNHHPSCHSSRGGARARHGEHA
jgi:hypothetical protein